MEVQYELRIYSLLGRLLGLRIAVENRDSTDIRLVPRESLSIEPIAIEPDLVWAIHRYCKRHQLSYCAFDFLRTADGRDLLVDVNPSGSWSFYESPAEPFVTRWFADTLSESIEK